MAKPYHQEVATVAWGSSHSGWRRRLSRLMESCKQRQ